MATITTPVVVNAASPNYTIAAADTLDVNGDDAITWEGVAPTVSVTNNGIIAGDADNSFTIGSQPVTGTMTFTNSVGALIASEFDVRDLATGGTLILNNSGLINTETNNGLRLATDGGVVTVNNEATGIIMTTEAGKDAIKDGSNSTINNHGKIIAAADLLLPSGEPDEDLSGADGIDFGDEGENNTVHNFAGGIIEGSKHGITGAIGITVVNDLGATITGRNGAGLNFDNGVDDDLGVTLADLPDRILTVTNHGNILGESRTYADSDGDAVDADGLLKLDNYGFIGGMGAHGEHDGGTNHAEGIAAGGGTIINRASGVIFSVDRGIQIDDSSEGNAYAATKITNAGLIQANNGEAINIVGTFGDTLTNSGTIVGDIVLGDGADKVTLKAGSNIIGQIQLGDGNDTLTAVEGKLDIDAGAGDDTIKAGSSADVINGGAGADTISGKGGIDKLTGGAGADTFVFALGDTANTNKTADTILDFSAKQHDMFDLSAFDANTGKKGNQDFTFIGDDAFHHKAGELRFEKTASDTYIYGDTNGDGKADFTIHLDDAVALKAGSFDL